MRLTRPVDVWLRRVHAEAELIEDAQIPSARRLGNARVRVVDQERVLLRQERCLPARRVLRVPNDLSLRRRHVHCDCVCSLIRRARGHDVDGRGRYRERSVVPGECDVVADFVELVAGKGVGRDHGDAAGW